LVTGCSRPLQVQIKYFQNGHTSGNQRHLCFFKCKGPILISYSATECAQSVSGTCLFIYLFYSCIVYPYTTRGWKILDYSTCCRKHHSIYDLVVFPGNTSRIIENFQSSSCIIYENMFLLICLFFIILLLSTAYCIQFLNKNSNKTIA
jgi:hypothetical protein